MLSGDAVANPQFHGYAKLLMPYCSADMYLGNATVPADGAGDGAVASTGFTKTTHFHGARIWTALVAKYLAPWLAGARRVVVVASSAAAIGFSAQRGGSVWRRAVAGKRVFYVYDSGVFEDAAFTFREAGFVHQHYLGQLPVGALPCAASAQSTAYLSIAPAGNRLCCMDLACSARANDASDAYASWHLAGVGAGAVAEPVQSALLVQSVLDAYVPARNRQNAGREPQATAAGNSAAGLFQATLRPWVEFRGHTRGVAAAFVAAGERRTAFLLDCVNHNFLHMTEPAAILRAKVGDCARLGAAYDCGADPRGTDSWQTGELATVAVSASSGVELRAVARAVFPYGVAMGHRVPNFGSAPPALPGADAVPGTSVDLYQAINRWFVAADGAVGASQQGVSRNMSSGYSPGRENVLGRVHETRGANAGSSVDCPAERLLVAIEGSTNHPGILAPLWVLFAALVLQLGMALVLLVMRRQRLLVGEEAVKHTLSNDEALTENNALLERSKLEASASFSRLVGTADGADEKDDPDGELCSDGITSRTPAWADPNRSDRSVPVCLLRSMDVSVPENTILHCDAGMNVTDELGSYALRFDRGQLVALIGKSGCGKSTFLKALGARYLLPEGVRFTVSEDCELHGVNTRDIACLGNFVSYVEQFPLVGLKDWKVADVFTQEARRGGVDLAWGPDQEYATLVWQALDLHTFSGRAVGMLSGGQVKKLATAIALLGRPNLLLLDEPTSGVSLMGQWRMLALLRRVCDNLGVCVLVVIHAPPPAAMCLFTDVLLFSDAKVALFAPTGRAFNDHWDLLSDFIPQSQGDQGAPAHHATDSQTGPVPHHPSNVHRGPAQRTFFRTFAGTVGAASRGKSTERRAKPVNAWHVAVDMAVEMASYGSCNLQSYGLVCVIVPVMLLFMLLTDGVTDAWDAGLLFLFFGCAVPLGINDCLGGWLYQYVTLRMSSVQQEKVRPASFVLGVLLGSGAAMGLATAGMAVAWAPVFGTIVLGSGNRLPARHCGALGNGAEAWVALIGLQNGLALFWFGLRAVVQQVMGFDGRDVTLANGDAVSQAFLPIMALFAGGFPSWKPGNEHLFFFFSVSPNFHFGRLCAWLFMPCVTPNPALAIAVENVDQVLTRSGITYALSVLNDGPPLWTATLFIVCSSGCMWLLFTILFLWRARKITARRRNGSGKLAGSDALARRHAVGVSLTA